MGFILEIKGKETIELGLENIISAEYMTDTPNDSNARSTDVGATVKIVGKILTPVKDAPADDSIKLALWSLVEAEKDDCYREMTLKVVAASKVIRQYHFSIAFVVDYTENFADNSGAGTFTILLKQKKDKTTDVKVEGGFEHKS
jgi:hypothetical protein